MTFRIAWKPYMYSQTLPHLLGGVRMPALVVWGSQDRIVPPECGERYARSLPNAHLELIEACGHFVEMEEDARATGRVQAGEAGSGDDLMPGALFIRSGRR